MTGALRRYGIVACLLLAGCGDTHPPAVAETMVAGELLLAVHGEGELKSAKPTPLQVPGAGWASRRVEWMLPEGSVVKKGELIARFSADEGKQDLALALLDLQRNALARAAKGHELQAAQGRVAVDLSQVAVQLAIAQRYAGADLGTLARNEVLDAIQDAGYLEQKQDTLQWQRGQSGKRGDAELALLDAQRATFGLTADNRRSDLDALELHAPNDGVLMLNASWSGVKPMPGTNLFAGSEFGNLPDASAMEVEIELPETESQGIRAGQAVGLHPLGRPEQAITSNLSWVASAAKVRNRNSPVKYLTMRAPVPTTAVQRYGLVPGQRMVARVVQLHAHEALSVANIALRNDDAGKPTVLVRDGDDFVPRRVALGVRGNARSQILSGLLAGDEVLLAAASHEASRDIQETGEHTISAPATRGPEAEALP